MNQLMIFSLSIFYLEKVYHTHSIFRWQVIAVLSSDESISYLFPELDVNSFVGN